MKAYLLDGVFQGTTGRTTSFLPDARFSKKGGGIDHAVVGDSPEQLAVIYGGLNETKELPVPHFTIIRLDEALFTPIHPDNGDNFYADILGWPRERILRYEPGLLLEYRRGPIHLGMFRGDGSLLLSFREIPILQTDAIPA